MRDCLRRRLPMVVLRIEEDRHAGPSAPASVRGFGGTLMTRIGLMIPEDQFFKENGKRARLGQKAWRFA